MPGTKFTIEVQPIIPERLKRLDELAGNLFYAWNTRITSLFEQLDGTLWQECGRNPRLFLRRVAQVKLDEAAADRQFMDAYNRALSAFDSYHQGPMATPVNDYLDPKLDLVAYFCAEFGLHESLPIYSGGLGILAGDHCKAASDLNLPFVGVGLLYRQGYFTQTLDAHGNQIAHFTPTDFDSLPISLAKDALGRELRVNVPVRNHQVSVRLWVAQAGHIRLVLLDSDIPENSDEDRSITYQLYGGDQNTRIQQEILLSLGGVRALRALGLAPTVWHMNEGHAAFLVLERCREYVAQGADFATALELSAACTVFTTHTPVPAGHDIFSHEMVLNYLGPLIKELGVKPDELLKIGESSEAPGKFNMTALALRGSRFHNGVSRIHGGVAARMAREIWPQIPPEENPIGYVTNGVHLPTFLAREWTVLLDMRFGTAWRNELLNPDYWQCIDEIPSQNFWSARQSLKVELLNEVSLRARKQYRRNGYSELQIERLTQGLNQDASHTLILGFARRFATYKRATLLFSDAARLARLLNDAARPVLVIFSGKAHPSDMPGQHLIKVIHEFSRKPEFEGKIILLEDYDLSLARHLVAGVDVWLNTPEYPLEASGTSGEKAGINGVLNLSILDGWWGEGYTGDNGWGITPHGPQYDNAFRNQEEARELLDILEHDVIPVYFNRTVHGLSEKWIQMSKASMRHIIPHFNAQRMVMDYVRDYYAPAARKNRQFSEGKFESPRLLARWKKRMRELWNGVSIKHIDKIPVMVKANEKISIRVSVTMNGLEPQDVIVECLFGKESDQGEFRKETCNRLLPTGVNEFGEHVFALDLEPPLSGLQAYKLRVYPYNRLLTHPFETGLMIWL